MALSIQTSSVQRKSLLSTNLSTFGNLSAELKGYQDGSSKVMSELVWSPTEVFRQCCSTNGVLIFKCDSQLIQGASLPRCRVAVVLLHKIYRVTYGYIGLYIRIHVYIYIYMCIFICVYIYIHKHMCFGFCRGLCCELLCILQRPCTMQTWTRRLVVPWHAII